jgi:hypothetical protein
VLVDLAGHMPLLKQLKLMLQLIVEYYLIYLFNN